MRINELYSWLIDNRNEIDSLWVQLANSYFYYSKISANIQYFFKTKKNPIK
jgi:hypothetical protein